MANTPEPNSEVDFESWLMQGERVSHTVNLYARMGLIAKVEEREKQIVPAPEIPEADESLAGEPNPNAEVEEQIAELYKQIDASKLAFHVTGRISSEVDSIRDEVLTTYADELAQEAGKGRAEADRFCKRSGVTNTADINNYKRLMAKEWSDRFAHREINYRIVAQSAKIITPSGGLQDIDLDQVRAMNEKLGDQQMKLLINAAYTAKDNMPEVTVPKS